MSPTRTLLTLFTALAFSATHTLAKQCAAFDNSGNLYLFGGSEDVNLGQSGSWAQPAVTPLTTTGRPPWTGNNTICLHGGYVDVLYVFDADSSNPGDIYLYDFSGSSWSKQTTTSPPDLSSGSTVLDHDTNVVFTLPGTAGSSLYTLDLSTLASATSASGQSIGWEAVSDPNFTVDGDLSMAQASQHIFFFGVDANPAGSANVFVVHYSYFQPEVQAFTETNGATSNFPSAAGVAIGVPADNAAGNQMIFVPDDASATYLITHWTNPSDYSSTNDAPSGINSFINTTQTLPAPAYSDPQAAYAASSSSLVQFASNGDIYYLSSFVNGYAANTNAAWQKISGYSVSGLSGTSGSTVASGSATGSMTGSAASGSMTASRTGAGASGSMTGSQTGSATGQSTGGTGAGVSLGVDGRMVGAFVAGVIALVAGGLIA